MHIPPARRAFSSFLYLHPRNFPSRKVLLLKEGETLHPYGECPMTFFRKTYISLDQKISPQEQKILEKSLRETLQLAAPPGDFVIELEDALLIEVLRQNRQQTHLWQGLGIAGLISGGLLSIVGSVWVWLRWQERQNVKTPLVPLVS